MPDTRECLSRPLFCPFTDVSHSLQTKPLRIPQSSHGSSPCVVSCPQDPEGPPRGLIHSGFPTPRRPVWLRHPLLPSLTRSATRIGTSRLVRPRLTTDPSSHIPFPSPLLFYVLPTVVLNQCTTDLRLTSHRKEESRTTTSMTVVELRTPIPVSTPTLSHLTFHGPRNSWSTPAPTVIRYLSKIHLVPVLVQTHVLPNPSVYLRPPVSPRSFLLQTGLDSVHLSSPSSTYLNGPNFYPNPRRSRDECTCNSTG